MKRPYFFDSIARLEALAADANTSKSCLDAIALELTFRSTFRARKLAKELTRRNGSCPSIHKQSAEPSDESPSQAQRSDAPSEALGIRLSTLTLSTRAQNALASLKVVLAADLCRLSEPKLLRTKNVGRKTVMELRTILRSLGLQFGMHVKADQVRAQPAVQIALPMELRVKEPSDLAGALKAHVDGATRNDRNADWVVQHLGWDGQPHRTLEIIGASANVTRERVRQVVANCTRRLEARETVPHALQRAIGIVERNAPISQSSLDRLFAEDGVATDGFYADGIKRAARVFGAKFPFCISEAADPLIIQERHADLPERLLRSAKIEVASHGAIVDDQLIEIWRETCGHTVSPEFVRAIMQTDESFAVLPGCPEWWWRPDSAARRRNRLVNTITKVMGACHCIPLRELREACRRHVRTNHLAPPTNVMRAICSSLPFLSVEGGSVERASDQLNWDDVLNPSEKLLADIFKRRGPVLDSYTVSEEGMALGINENSLQIYKTYSPILCRPIAGYYAVVGSDIPVGLIEELERRKERPTKSTLEFGWTADHRIMVGRRISEGLWLSGIASLPAAVQKFVSDDFPLFAFGKYGMGSVTVREGNVFGLKPFLRMFGGDPGDVLVLLFDPKQKRCDSWLGGNELSDVIQLGPDAMVAYLSGAPQQEASH